MFGSESEVYEFEVVQGDHYVGTNILGWFPYHMPHMAIVSLYQPQEPPKELN